ncbi:hypothetical protein P3T43_000345 [Paraburkholderia sp. GAS41]|jgi:hypothetical protein
MPVHLPSDPSSVIRSPCGHHELSQSGKYNCAAGGSAVPRSSLSLARVVIRAVFAGVVLSVALSGCGVFCGAAGGSGGALAGGCSTGLRF